MSETLNALQLLEKEEVENLFESLGLELDGIDFLTGEQPEANEELVSRLKIYDLSSLNWVLRKRDAYLAQLAEIKRVANEELNRINAWQEKASKGPEGTIKFFDFLIQEYTEQQRRNNPEWKKQTTPYGEVGYHKMPMQWTYPDEPAFIDFLTEHEALQDEVKTEVKVSFDKGKIKKRFEAQYNVFVLNDMVVDLAVGDTKQGMQYMIEEEELVTSNDFEPTRKVVVLKRIIDMTTNEPAPDVVFMESVVTYDNKVVPGVKLQEQPDKLQIKGAK